VFEQVPDRESRARVIDFEGYSDLVKDGGFIDDRLFVSMAWNHTALVWDLASMRPLLTFHDVDAMAISDDRHTVAFAGTTGVRLWSPRTPTPDLDSLRALHLK